MSVDAHAFAMVDGPPSGNFPAASQAYFPARAGLLIESAATAIDRLRLPAPFLLVLPAASMTVPMKRALHARQASRGASWIPPRADTLAGHAAAADPGLVVRSRFTRLLALAERIAPRGVAPGWAGLFEQAGALLDLIDVLESNRATAWLAAGAPGDPPSADEQAMLTLLQTAALATPGQREILLGSDLRLLAALAAGMSEPDDPVRIAALQWRALLRDWRAEGALVVRIGLRPLPASADDPVAASFDAEPSGSPVLSPEDRLLLALRRAAPEIRLVDLHPDSSDPLPAAARPFFAAWPEAQPDRVPKAPPTSIAARRLSPGPAAAVAGRLLHARTREDEAAVAAEWVHRCVSDGARTVAVVVLDRWLARRTRALLERGGVLVDDREGWALSTTVAASWPMAWLDYCAAIADGGRRGLSAAIALSTLLDSAFTRHPAAPPLSAFLRGEQRSRSPAAAAPEAAALDADLMELAVRQRQASTLKVHRDLLARAMALLDADAAMRDDEAGRQLLALIDALPMQAVSTCRLEAFRALLGFALERRRFHDAGITSPVAMIGLEAALAEHHDAVLVLGANDGRLPAAAPLPPALSEPMLPRLGLAPVVQQLLAQTQMLAWVLAGAPHWAFTCRTEAGDGSLPSPLVERLAAVAGVDLARAQSRPGLRRLDPAPGDRWPMPRPAEVAPGLPAVLPVGAVERLVGCPYEFLLVDVWGLRDSEDPIEAPGARELGILVHDVLLRFHREVPDPTLHDRATLCRRLAELTAAVVAATPSLRADRLVRLQEWFGQIDGYVKRFLADHAQGWRFAGGEGRIEGRIDYPSRTGGATVVVRGVYDRLDRKLDPDVGPGAAGPSRIVDYKLQSAARFRKMAKDPDQAAQLMLYSWFAGADEALYLVLERLEIVAAPLDPSPADALPAWRKRLARQFGRIADGEPLRALGSHCGRCRARGVCRQGHWHDRAADLAAGGTGAA